MQKYSKINIGNLSKQIKVPQKYYEFWEINDLIPTLEFYVSELLSMKKTIMSLMDVLEKCEEEGGNKIDPIAINLQKKLKHHCSEYISVIEKLAELGAVVDDMDIIAFDFYSWHDGEEVFLCWQSGEYSVSHWHYPEESFSERRILEGTDVLALNDICQILN